MLELVKKKSHDATVELIVKTNEGEFAIHRCEDGDIQVGSESNTGIESYVISTENIEIYNKFAALYKKLYNGVDEEDITIASREFQYDEASYLTVGIDKGTRSIILTLTESDSSTWKDHSWVTIPNDLQPLFNALYEGLNNLNDKANQISILEYIDIVMNDPEQKGEYNNDLVRTRKILSGNKQ